MFRWNVSTRPVDLTTLAASVDLPPEDHPIFAGPIKSATDGFPDMNMSKAQMVAKITTLEFQVARLFKLLGADANGYE